ncbi:EamA family transporter [Nocardioides panacisoli]|uniref:EamA family transporter n=1 Tax=Nocardioides panacisoli TaxID=627624 RepID=UPI001C628C39|nr:EamA family transporter [Nocardioides panacisoli]QYJ05669.1 EamA family transporter [Nocardioides panacisoli]
MRVRPATGSLPVPPWTLAVTAMLSVQLGSALSVGLIAEVGPAGTAWLRLTLGALVFLALARPPLRTVTRRDVAPLVGLGVTTGLVTITFLAAIERIPLGTAVAIEFLGPLTVAAVRSHDRRQLRWPALALLGVVLLTQPWQGEVNVAGVTFAALGALGWGTYIVLTQHVGDRFSGISGLSLTIPIAAATAALFGVPQASGAITPAVVAAAAGLALLLPALPFALEMLALRHLTHTAFGTLMALEPAFGLLLGAVVLHQRPDPEQLLGIILVVLAGAAAQRQGRRAPTSVAVVDVALERRHAVAVDRAGDGQQRGRREPDRQQGDVAQVPGQAELDQLGQQDRAP